ncbi:MAG TPA: prenyltransferase/squalene oxidase repeat-containing protein [Planctomycetota bacterium]|nr:prenyltransferase/squalene oxidase repeat-containing protein [Planctomycetota bacterium]
MRLAVPALALVAAFSLCRAEDAKDLPTQRAEAIEKGIAYLKKVQASDGSWDDTMMPFGGLGHMKPGTTALGALALLKSGVAPDDPCIKKAFEFIVAGKLEHTYDVGCILMALEARFNWEQPHLDDAPGTQTVERKTPAGKKIKMTPADLELAQKCVEFLKTKQGPVGWTYPPAANGFREDVSNTQYALLGLDAAERLGVEVPKEVYVKAQELLVANQEKDGPEVSAFPVPGADMSYKELKKIEKDTKDAIKKIEGAFKGKKQGDTNAAGHTEEDERRSTEEDAAKKVFKTSEKAKAMKARGWGYAFTPDKSNGMPPAGDAKPTGAMTTAGLACLFICKAHLDGSKEYEKNLKAPIDHALRDGAAWMAKNFSVTQNPAGRMHLLYYLYGLERAGVLLLVPKFGEHDWYDEGTREILKTQKTDGNWDAGGQGTAGPMTDTCFALLFLARGTTPIVRIPTRTATGVGGDSPKPDAGK